MTIQAVGLWLNEPRPDIEAWKRVKTHYLARVPERTELLVQRMNQYTASRPARDSKNNLPDDYVPVIKKDYKMSIKNDNWRSAWKTGAIIMSPYVRVKEIKRFPTRVGRLAAYEYKAFGDSEAAASHGNGARVVGSIKRPIGSNETVHFFVPNSRFLADLSLSGLAALKDFNPDRTEMFTALVSSANRAAYDLATELAEAGKTIPYLAGLVPRIEDALSSLYRAYRKMRNPGQELARLRRLIKKKNRRFEPGKVPDPLKAASDYWLEYTYAVRPLMFSVRDVTRALSMDGRLYQTFRQRRMFSDQKQYIHGDYTVDTLREVTYRAMCRQCVNSNMASKVQLWLPTAIWEVVPYSFVVDWFVGVGDYLQSLRPFTGEQQVFSWSIRETIRQTITINEPEQNQPLPINPHPDYTQKWYDGIRATEFTPASGTLYEWEYDSYNRAAPCQPVAGIRFRNNLVGNRQISAVALSYKQLSRLR